MLPILRVRKEQVLSCLYLYANNIGFYVTYMHICRTRKYHVMYSQYPWSIFTDNPGTGLGKLIWLLLNAKKIILLVVFYGAANLLTYFALARVEASVYAVVLQVITYNNIYCMVDVNNKINIYITSWKSYLLPVSLCSFLVATFPGLSGEHWCFLWWVAFW